MLIPIRCFSCNKVLDHATFEELRSAQVPCATALDRMRLTRMCCRRMLIATPPMLEETLVQHPMKDTTDPNLFLDVRVESATPREVGCA